MLKALEVANKGDTESSLFLLRIGYGRIGPVRDELLKVCLQILDQKLT